MKKFLLTFTFFLANLITLTTVNAKEAITTQEAKLQSEPSYLSKVVGFVPKNTSVPVILCTQYWCRVNYHNLNGWISTSLIHYKDHKYQHIHHVVVPINHRFRSHSYHHNYYHNKHKKRPVYHRPYVTNKNGQVDIPIAPDNHQDKFYSPVVMTK